jgi:HK97 family phage prohead protease
MGTTHDVVIANAERILAAGAGAPAADPHELTGYGFNWTSIAYGDRGPTRIMPDAFGAGPFAVPLLWMHQDHNPIGKARLTTDDKGLYVRARISDTCAGRDALALTGDGALTGLSLGYMADETHKGKDGVRVVTRGRLMELSLVTYPADAAARVSTVGGKYVQASPVEIERAAAVGLRTLNRRAAREAAIEAAEAQLIGVSLPSRTVPARPRWSGDEVAQRLARYANTGGGMDYAHWCLIDAAERGTRR